MDRYINVCGNGKLRRINVQKMFRIKVQFLIANIYFEYSIIAPDDSDEHFSRADKFIVMCLAKTVRSV